jgi:hypothetical protein
MASVGKGEEVCAPATQRSGQRGRQISLGLVKREKLSVVERSGEGVVFRLEAQHLRLEIRNAVTQPSRLLNQPEIRSSDVSEECFGHVDPP